MDEAEWTTAIESLREALGADRAASYRFDVIDLSLPTAGGGIEVMVGFDETHLPSKKTSWLFALQDELAMRTVGQADVVGIYISADRIPIDMFSEALARMQRNDVIPLTLEQAKKVAAQDGDLIDVLGPIRELVQVAASRPENDLANAADALLNQVEVLVEQFEA